MRWEGAFLLHDLLLSLCRISTFHLNICNHMQVVPGALYLECRNLYCTNQDILFTALEVAEDWFILVRSAHPAAVGFNIICLENPSELKSKFQNKLLSFSSAAWLHASWEIQRFFCLNASLNLVFITVLMRASAWGIFPGTTASVWPPDVEVGFQLHLIYVNDEQTHQSESEPLNHCRSAALKERKI